MNAIHKELYKPLNEEFSRVLSKYGTHRVEFSCTTKGFYVWFYTDDKVLGNIAGYKQYEGTVTDVHKRERTYDEIIELERSNYKRYSYYLLDLDRVDCFIDKLRKILIIK